MIQVYGNSIVNEAITGTELENMRPLFVGPCIIALSEGLPVKELLRATKRIPKIHLLGRFSNGCLIPINKCIFQFEFDLEDDLILL